MDRLEYSDSRRFVLPYTVFIFTKGEKGKVFHINEWTKNLLLLHIVHTIKKYEGLSILSNSL